MKAYGQLFSFKAELDPAVAAVSLVPDGAYAYEPAQAVF